MYNFLFLSILMIFPISSYALSSKDCEIQFNKIAANKGLNAEFKSCSIKSSSKENYSVQLKYFDKDKTEKEFSFDSEICGNAKAELALLCLKTSARLRGYTDPLFDTDVDVEACQPDVLKGVQYIQYKCFNGRVKQETSLKYYKNKENKTVSDRDGKEIIYRDSGDINICNYKMGKKHGECKCKDLGYIENYQNDLLHGEAIYFDDKGNVTEKANYNNGVKVLSQKTTIDSRGIQAETVENKSTGLKTEKVMSSSGKLIALESRLKGSLHGQSKYFYDDGKIALEVNYKEGKIAVPCMVHLATGSKISESSASECDVAKTNVEHMQGSGKKLSKWPL